MTDNNTQQKQNSQQPRTFYEDISVAGNQLVEQVEKLIKEGNIRRLIVKDQNGRTLIEMPLTLGVVASAGVAMMAWPLAVIGALAALVTRVQIIVERYENPADAEKDTQATTGTGSQTNPPAGM